MKKTLKPFQMAELTKACTTTFLSSSPLGGKTIADVRNQQPFEPRKWEPRERDENTLRAPLRKPPCRACKKEQAGIKLQEYLLKPKSKQLMFK